MGGSHRQPEPRDRGERRGQRIQDQGALARVESSRRVALPESPRVLLVEDDDMVRRALARMLRQLSFEVLAASSGSEALELFERLRAQSRVRRVSRDCVDLLVTDWSMPAGNGLSLARVLRRALPHLPVVFVSGFSDLGDDCCQGPDCRFLAKPFGTAELERTVRSLDLVPASRSAEVRP